MPDRMLIKKLNV